MGASTNASDPPSLTLDEELKGIVRADDPVVKSPILERPFSRDALGALSYGLVDYPGTRHRIRVNESGVYRIEVRAHFDPYLILRDSTNLVLTEDDDKRPMFPRVEGGENFPVSTVVPDGSDR